MARHTLRRSRLIPWRLMLGLVAALAAVCQQSAPAAEAKYAAVYVDGRRIEGNAIQGWHDERAEAKLENNSLTNKDQPLRWLRDLSLQNTATDALDQGFVEFVGGDRLPGRVVGYDAGEQFQRAEYFALPHLVVQPSVTIAMPNETGVEQTRVLLRAVRRVVWGAGARHDIKPATIFYRDGRMVSFRGLRWDDRSVNVLLEDGPRRIDFQEIAEVHLPAVDPWNAYLQELALIAPDNTARLMRVETVDGVIATTSSLRFKAAVHGGAGDPNAWYHMVQPHWSLDPLWLKFTTIRARLYFAPHEVPLVRLYPTQVVQKSLLGGGWRWQSDRNVQGGPLRSGGQHHGWGIGVHTFSELVYELSPLARTFRARLGLDQVAGNGGCVRGSVFVGKSTDKPIFQSDFLVGSARGVDTGDLALPTAGGSPVRLVLQADPAHEGRPSGADPLDVRDALDWLEPMVTLEPNELRTAIDAKKFDWLPAWNGWTLSDPPAAALVINSVWESQNIKRHRFTIAPAAPKGLTLTRELEVGPRDNWLLVGVRRMTDQVGGKLAIRIDGEPVAEGEIPIGPSGITSPSFVSLSGFRGRTVRVDLEVSTDKPGPLAWSGIWVAQDLPFVARVFDDDAATVDPPPPNDPDIRLVDVDPYAGSAALEVTAGEGKVARISPLKIRVRENPSVGEYRFARFALRIGGNTRAALDFSHANAQQKPARYDAGVGPPALDKAIRVIATAPPMWVIINRDLYADFGPIDIDALSLMAIGDGHAQFDYFYVARRQQDFDQVDADGQLSPQAEKVAGPLAAFQSAIEKAKGALVELAVEGNSGAGVIISADGVIATTGYVAVAPGKPVDVTLADGRKATGKTLGVNRDIDSALVKLDEAGPWPFVEIGNSAQGRESGRWLALAPLVGDKKEPRTGAAAVRFYAGQNNALWISLDFQRAYAGGALLNQTGQLVGLHSRRYTPGGTMEVVSNDIQASRDRMLRGEVWGTWPTGLVPLFGTSFISRDGKVQIAAVANGSAAAKAGIQAGDVVRKIDAQDIATLQDILKPLAQKFPGETANVELTRGDQPVTVQVQLERRK